MIQNIKNTVLCFIVQGEDEMKDEIVLMNQLITTAFDLLREEVPNRVDMWFTEEIGELQVKQYNDEQFMDDWREQKRIKIYNLMADIQKACYRSRDEFVLREEQ